MPFYSINPSNEQLIAEWDSDSKSTVLTKIENSSIAFNRWKMLSTPQRLLKLEKFKSLLEEELVPLAELITQEMGKPIEQSKAEVKKCISLIEYYSDVAEKVLVDDSLTEKAVVSKQPLGVLLGIMPWNFPIWQTLRFSVPSLAAGNTILLKPAPNVIGASTKLANLFEESGLGQEFQLTCCEVEDVESIISHPKVQGVSLTGSTKAGKSVAKLCGQYLKKSVFELGGSDPAIFLEDADLNSSVKKAVKSRLLNSGQSCIAAKRFLVHENIFDEFKKILIEEFKTYGLGDPMLRNTSIGPIARKDLLENISSQKKKALKKGAKLIFESEEFIGNGYYFKPTILEVDSSHEIFFEEVFGPMALISKFKTEEEMIELANSTSFGLGASIYTKNSEKAFELMKYKIDSGTCFINDFVKSSPEIPFGGVKDSGLGRELGTYGLLEFVNIKTIVK